MKKNSSHNGRIKNNIWTSIVLCLLVCGAPIIFTGCEEDSRQKAEFKAAFSVEWPNNSVEKDAIRPKVIGKLKDLKTETDDLHSKAGSERGEANSLPCVTQQDIERRVAAFHHCEVSEAHLNEVLGTMTADANLAKAAGFSCEEIRQVCGGIDLQNW